MPKIKICGLTRPQDIDIVNETLPDYIGFVFAESRRRVTPAQAAALKRRLDQRIKAVGVFVNHDPGALERLAGDGVVDLVQLHGDEDAAYIEEIRRHTGLRIIKAVRVQSPEQLLAAQALPCEMLLLDTFRQGAYGGTGTTFDYGLIPPLQKPFLLAGGLNARNLGEALAVGPYGVDLSGGAEQDGVKDAEKIREIVKLVRNHRRNL